MPFIKIVSLEHFIRCSVKFEQKKRVALVLNCLEKQRKKLGVDIKDLFNAAKTSKEPKDEVQNVNNPLENLNAKPP